MTYLILISFFLSLSMMLQAEKTVLVTGGAGFLGSHLCKALIDKGNRVIAVDNLYTGSIKNIQDLFENKNFSFLEHDIINPLNIDEKIDWIFNFACPASPPHYQKDPIFTTKTCILGSLNMLELARLHNARIMQASTSEVYGDPLMHPQQEIYLGNVSCTGPRACYDEGKRCAESLFFDYKRTYNLDIKVIRIFNTYGPNMDPHDGRVISNFIMQALENRPITVYGDGTQTRSFCYVDDLIAGILAMMNSDSNLTGPINLGNPTEFTLLELVDTIKKLLHVDVPLHFEPLPKDDPTRRMPDITVAKNLLDWQPRVTLEAGLQKTISYFKNHAQHKDTTIMIIGAGYVGLVTGACFAQKGNNVIIVENNQEKVDTLLQGKIPFYEPLLHDIVVKAISNKTLTFETSIKKGIAHHPSIIFSCVGTPPHEDGSSDLSYVETVAQELGAHMTDYMLIVNKSTVPVGTAKKIVSIIQKQLDMRHKKIAFDIVSNPEFLKEGSAVNDFLMPDRIIIGTGSEKATQILFDLYKPFISNKNKFLCMSIEAAELTKYASNAMLATRISFINQLALLSDQVGVDIEQVKTGMSRDARIGPAFLNAGIGYGGSCFPKDVAALVHLGQQNHIPMTLIQEVEKINIAQRLWFINQISNYYGPTLVHKKAGIWGLAFKPETDDIRCSPSLDIIDALLSHQVNIIAYDPAAGENIKKIYGNSITLAQTAHDVLAQADFLIILTEWKLFLNILPHQFLQLKDKLIFDGRNCYDPQTMRSAGLTYLCIGRNS